MLIVACSHCVSAIPLADFYPFGSLTPDDNLPANDDGSTSEIPLTTPFPFFDENQDGVFVS